jgi:cell division protein FtsB
VRIQKFDMFVTLGCCTLLAFFGWHAFKGPRGFDYRDKLIADGSKLQVELAAVTNRRDESEARVKLLRPDQLDPDMVDEMARQTLNLARPNELIVRNPQ